VGQGGLKVLSLWRHSQKKHIPQSKKIFSSADWKTCRVFWDFYWVCRAYRTVEILAQSHVRLGVFFFENPRKQPDAKVLTCKMLSKEPIFSNFITQWSYTITTFVENSCKIQFICIVFFSVFVDLSYLQTFMLEVKLPAIHLMIHHLIEVERLVKLLMMHFFRLGCWLEKASLYVFWIF